MESVIFIVRRNMEALEDMGIHVSEIRSLGGGARSRIWKQIEADITQKSVYTMKNEEAACLGAAILAGNAVGMYRSIDEACEKMITVKERFDPNPMNFNTYERIYQNYVQLYNNLCPMFERE
jgi:xylulokinase